MKISESAHKKHAGRHSFLKRGVVGAATLSSGFLINGISALGEDGEKRSLSNYLFRIYNKLGISSRVELVLVLMKRPDIHRGTS